MLLMTVATTVFPASRPSAFSCLPANEQHGIAVNDAAALIDEDRAVSIAVEGHAECETPFDDDRRQALRMSGPTIEVDVAAVRFVPDGRDVEAELAEDARRHGRRGAVGTIDTDPRAPQPACVSHDRFEMGHIPIHEALAGDRIGLALRHGPRGIRHNRLDVALEIVGELFTGAGKDLDAVVFERIVRGRDHDAGREIRAAGQVRHARGRDDAGAHDIRAARTRSVRQLALDPLTGLAGVAPDEKSRMPFRERANERSAEAAHRLMIQGVRPRLAPDAVCTKESRCHRQLVACLRCSGTYGIVTRTLVGCAASVE